MRAVIVLFAMLGLSGCVDMDSLIPSKNENIDRSYYLLDTKLKFFCIGNTKVCRDMTKIVSSRSLLQPIEEAYNQEVKGPNYPVTLARMIINPADGSYKTKPVGSEGRYIQVPKNDRTNIVWDTLSFIEEDLFNTRS